MSNNITINTNQNPYFDDFDDDKNFHQVLYKPSLPVQARELTTQQSILRDQVKKFGDHIFKNGSKVTGGELVLNLDYEYVKLQPQYNGVDINVEGFAGKTVVGTQTGTKALVIGNSSKDVSLGDPDTIYVKYITGGSETNSVQGIRVVTSGSGYTIAPNVTITGNGTGAQALAVISSGQVIAINVTSRGSGYTETPIIGFTGGDGDINNSVTAVATLETSPSFLPGERIHSTDLSISANVVSSIPTNIQSYNVTRGGSGYTEAPVVTIANAPVTGVNATATSTISGGVVTSITVVNQGSGYTEAPAVTIADAPAGGVNALATSNLATAVGKGSSVSIAEGVFYINGNFIKTAQQTLILQKYFNDPSYKIGLTVSETIVNSGEDLSLLDNAQGSSNFAAPGADRLKYNLILSKKLLTSEDDSDFYELLRVNKGIKEQDIKVPVYSVLEDTFARRTFDESGSYTVRSFNIQLKDHPDATENITKFIVRLDPGKAFIEGFEFETLVSQDIEVERALSTVNVNGFDRLMQYGNFMIVKELKGLFDITTHEEVDLHNVTYSNIDLNNYANTKVGTAKVRSLDFSSSTAGANRIFNLYIYDVQMTNQNFGEVESVVVPENITVTPVVLSARANIDDTGKEGVSVSGDAKLFETSDSTLVFKLPQDTIQTIRGLNDVIDTNYTTKRVFRNQQFNNGTTTIATAGASETFIGSGSLGETITRENYFAVVKNPLSSGLTQGDIVRFDVFGASITVTGPQDTSAVLNAGNSLNFTADIIATLNISGKQEKIKNIVKSSVKQIPAPSHLSTVPQSLERSDVWSLDAIYDSGDINTAATLPTLTVNSTPDTLMPGETITGLNSGATGIVIEGIGGTSSVTYVVTSGTFVAENITGATTNFTKVVTSVAAGDTVITDRYDIDNGQRDNFYDHGSIQLKTGATAPTGQISHSHLSFWSIVLFRYCMV